MIKEFELGPYTWNVKERKRLRKGVLGMCYYHEDKKQIDLATVNPTNIEVYLSEDSKRHTFLHELTHAILFTMEHPLAENEEFVSKFSDLLYQFEKTKK